MYTTTDLALQPVWDPSAETERTVAEAIAAIVGLPMADVLSFTPSELDDHMAREGIFAASEMEQVPADWAAYVLPADDTPEITLGEWLNEPREEPTDREYADASWGQIRDAYYGD